MSRPTDLVDKVTEMLRDYWVILEGYSESFDEGDRKNFFVLV